MDRAKERVVISAISSILGNVSVQTVQSVNTSVGTAAEQEERKKKSHVPSIEVSAAQSQGLSPRVGDFLVNKASQSNDSGSGVSGASGPDGSPPAGPPPGGPPPGAAPGGPQGGGANNNGGSSSSESALKLLSDDEDSSSTDESSETTSSKSTSSSASSILSLLSGEDSTGETENDGDADDQSSSASAKKTGQGANTQYARQQQGSGVFGVQFDEVGAYQFAASSY
jgi:hypothetical protein